MTTIVPIFICVVLPIAVVLIVALTKINSDNKRAQILMKAIECNNEVETEKLIESLNKAKKTPREILNLRLLRGCIFSLTGVALAIVGTISLANGYAFNDDPVIVSYLFGGLSLAIGLSYIIVYYMTRKQDDTPEKD